MEKTVSKFSRTRQTYHQVCQYVEDSVKRLTMKYRKNVNRQSRLDTDVKIEHQTKKQLLFAGCFVLQKRASVS